MRATRNLLLRALREQSSGKRKCSAPHLGVAIIGAGRIGGLRAQLAARHPAVRYLAVADVDLGKAQKLGAGIGAQLVTGDSIEAISNPAVNAVIVSTSEHEHVAPVIAALKLGKAVLVEKPIALSLDDADAIMTALEQSTAGLHVGYSRRFKRRYLLAKEQILRGRLGDIVGMSARLYNSRAQVFQMLDRHAGATPVVDSLTYTSTSWDGTCRTIQSRKYGHAARAACIRDAGYDCDDVTYAVLTLADGALVNLSVSFALPEKYPSLGYCGRIELLGTQGVHIIDDDHLEQLLYTDRGIPHIYIPDHTVNMAFLGSSAPGDWAVGDFWGPLANETRSWLDHLATGRECALATAREARDNLQITLAIEEAVRSHKSVHLTRKER